MKVGFWEDVRHLGVKFYYGDKAYKGVSWYKRALLSPRLFLLFTGFIQIARRIGARHQTRPDSVMANGSAGDPIGAFVDQVHLFDTGNAVVANHILRLISR